MPRYLVEITKTTIQHKIVVASSADKAKEYALTDRNILQFDDESKTIDAKILRTIIHADEEEKIQ